MSLLANKPHCVYSLRDVKDRLLYVGCTVDLTVRMAQHRSSQPWWHEVDESKTESVELLNKAIARRYERLLVRDGEPKYNKRLTPSTTLPATPSTAAFKTTQEAAQLLNTNYEALRKFLQRFPEHRPASQLGRTWVWTLEEIENMRNLL